MYPPALLQENTCLKNSVVNAPPSIAMSPSILFWFAFFRMFSSTVRSHTSLGQSTHVKSDTYYTGIIAIVSILSCYC